MHGQGKYKFKVIKGILSWRNDEMEKFEPVSAEILTRVILLYEKQFKQGIEIWDQIVEQQDQRIKPLPEDPIYLELAAWMKELRGIFVNTDPHREKEKWMDNQINLN
jgi:hypothetical protein